MYVYVLIIYIYIYNRMNILFRKLYSNESS